MVYHHSASVWCQNNSRATYTFKTLNAWAITPSLCWSQCCRQHSRQSPAFLPLGPNGYPRLAKTWSGEGNQTPRRKAEVQIRNRRTSFSCPVTLQQCVSFFMQRESGTRAEPQLVATGERRHEQETLLTCVRAGRNTENCKHGAWNSSSFSVPVFWYQARCSGCLESSDHFPWSQPSFWFQFLSSINTADLARQVDWLPVACVLS